MFNNLYIKPVFFILIIFCPTPYIYGQNKDTLKKPFPEKNIVLGLPTPRGIGYYIGYEQFYLERKKLKMSALIGFAIVPGNMLIANKINDWQKAYLISPINALFKIKTKTFLELNFSFAIRDGYFLNYSNNSYYIQSPYLIRIIFINYHAFIGLRRYFCNNRFSIKAGYVPWLEAPKELGLRIAFNHSFEIAFGYKFSKKIKKIKK